MNEASGGTSLAKDTLCTQSYLSRRDVNYSLLLLRQTFSSLGILGMQFPTYAIPCNQYHFKVTTTTHQ